MAAKPMKIKVKIDIVSWAEAPSSQKAAWDAWAVLLKESQDKATNGTGQE